MKHLFTLAAAFALVSAFSANAEVRLPSIISDNMVLQQQADAALWGWAEPGRKVSVKTGWDKKKTVVTADSESGKWMVRVATPAAGGPYEITISDGKPVTLHNVLIGEVWYCSGQSNMEMKMVGYASQPAKGAAEAVACANPSRPIRICKVPHLYALEPQDTTAGSWKENTPDAIAESSAPAWFFADMLEKALGVPVGLLEAAWGGSSIEAWMPRDLIEKEFPEFDLSHLNGGRKFTEDQRRKLPCMIYNGEANPIIPFTFKGMLWYQGESNRARPDQYARLQIEFVKMMREKYEYPDMPFYFVQISPYPYGDPDSFMLGYFYEAQQKALEAIPNSGMVTTCDIGEKDALHPSRKDLVGKRLAMLALQHSYGRLAINADAPTYKSVRFKDGVATVQFNVDGNGLNPKGERALMGFEIAGEDKVFHKADAAVYKNCYVKLKCDAVPNPVAVRYCFRNWCQGNLYNCWGIPAAPFRTDDWNL